MSKPIVLGVGTGKLGICIAAGLGAMGYRSIRELDESIGTFDPSMFNRTAQANPFTERKNTFTPPHKQRHGKKKKRGQKRR